MARRWRPQDQDTGPLIYPCQSSPPNDRSVQQGRDDALVQVRAPRARRLSVRHVEQPGVVRQPVPRQPASRYGLRSIARVTPWPRPRGLRRWIDLGIPDGCQTCCRHLVARVPSSAGCPISRPAAAPSGPCPSAGGRTRDRQNPPRLQMARAAEHAGLDQDRGCPCGDWPTRDGAEAALDLEETGRHG